MSLTYLWLIVGVVFAALEALGIPGVGMLFAGLGALTVGIVMYLGMIAEEAATAQFVVFFASTAAWGALLWKPLQRLRLTKEARGYNNVVGETAYAGPAGITKESGEALWSGTTMKARLAADVGIEKLSAGAPVVIADVSGVTLIVKPK